MARVMSGRVSLQLTMDSELQCRSGIIHIPSLYFSRGEEDLYPDLTPVTSRLPS
jgi:hypothetical protein